MAVLLTASLPGLAETAEPGYRVIVNAANPTESLARAEVAQLFFKRTRQWPEGAGVEPVDLSLFSQVRLRFTQRVLRHQSVSDVRKYWEGAAAGGLHPIPVRADEAEVVEFVASRAGAVGYVGADATLPATVRVLRVEE